MNKNYNKIKKKTDYSGNLFPSQVDDRDVMKDTTTALPLRVQSAAAHGWKRSCHDFDPESNLISNNITLIY